MASKSGLGRGLSSLIPQKDQEAVIAKAAAQSSVDTGSALLEVPLSKVHHNPRQPRQEFGEAELEELADSIKQHGILQPLVVSLREDGEYELIAGERRLRAAKQARLERVPVVVRTVSDQEKLELALIENIQRQDLNAYEEALAYRALMDEFNLTQEQVAKRVGKSRPAVANTVRLLDLPEEILKSLRSGKLSRSHAKTLLAERDPSKQRALYREIISGGITVRAAEAKAGGKRRDSAGKDPNLADLEQQLQEALGTRVSILEKEGRGKIVIDFYSKEELRQLFKRFKA